jgi:trans-aconitate 2-methyltransferase
MPVIWNPNLYLKNLTPRLRPALDLLRSAVLALPPGKEATDVRNVLDLGCGPGNMTKYLCNAFPNAKITGVDSSSEMIKAANEEHKKMIVKDKDRIEFKLDTIENFVNTNFQKYDIVYSNATLHWIPSSYHKMIFPAIINNVMSSSGILAVQMPDTKNQQSHLLMETAALRTGLIDMIADVNLPHIGFEPSWYHKLLTPLCKDVDMWKTEYIQQLPHGGSAKQPVHPVLEYTKATGMQPILLALGGEDSDESKKFLKEYERLMVENYPVSYAQNNNYRTGKFLTLYPFKRFFIICET